VIDSSDGGTRNSLLFTALGIVGVVAGVTYLDGWLVWAIGTVITVGGVSSLVSYRLGQSQGSAVPMIVTGLVIGGLLVWHGYRRGAVLWPAVGCGIATALVLLWQFPSRQEFSWGALTVTFGAAGLWLVANGTLLTGLVLVGWGVIFARESYQNRPAATD
jgi:hypothetical protein